MLDERVSHALSQFGILKAKEIQAVLNESPTMMNGTTVSVGQVKNAINRLVAADQVVRNRFNSHCYQLSTNT